MIEKVSKYKEIDLADALQKAENGDVSAMRDAAYNLLYENVGDTIEPEIAERCIRYLETAIAAGDPDAMLDLGGMYLDGMGIPKDRDKALHYYLMAAETGFPYAYHRLASFYLYEEDTEGLGYLPPTNDPERRETAYQYFMQGADAGHGGCMNEVGLMWMLGEIGEANPQNAFSWFRKAWDTEYADPSDYAYSANLIAQCLHNGVGTGKDLELAKTYAQYSVEIETSEKKKGRSRTDYFLNQYKEELYEIVAELEE